MSNLKVNGQFLICYADITGDAGVGTGLARVTVPVLVHTLEQVAQVNPVAVAETLGLVGFVCTARPYKTWANNKFIISFQFEGTSGPSITYIQRLSNATYHLDVNTRQESLETHPFFTQIKARYGWDATNQRIQDNKPDNTDANPANVARASHYEPFGVIFTIRYSVDRLDGEMLTLLGTNTILSVPPGFTSTGLVTPADCNWRFMGTRCSQNSPGGPYSVEEPYQLSGVGGWVEDFYRLNQWV